MKFPKTDWFSKAFVWAAILGLGISAPANAEIIQGGGVTIEEINGDINSDIIGDFGSGVYNVSNNSDLTLFAFGVVNNNDVFPYTQFATASDGAFITWSSEVVDAFNWGSFEVFDANYNLVALSSFGEFTDFFAPGDSVNFYWGEDTDFINPGASVQDAFFFAPALFASSGVVFGTSSSGVNSAIAVNPVPVPAAIWLFGSGLLGLAGIARRRDS